MSSAPRSQLHELIQWTALDESDIQILKTYVSQQHQAVSSPAARSNWAVEWRERWCSMWS